MEYAEFLRVRGTIKWHLGILAAALLLGLIFGHTMKVNVNDPDGSHLATVASGMRVALAWMAPIGMFFAAIFASSAGGSLNREFGLRDIAWTKPLSRGALALRYVLIDVAAVVLLYALTLAAVAVLLLRFGVTPYVDAGFVATALLGCGVSVMWYALVQVLSCRFPPQGVAVGGILWPVALLSLGLADLHNVVGTAARALDVINPLAYMNGVTFGPHGAVVESLWWQLPAGESALIVWGFSVLFVAVAIALWVRREN
jgi:hypothetical protein